jgi:hypothetical protein
MVTSLFVLQNNKKYFFLNKLVTIKKFNWSNGYFKLWKKKTQIQVW